MRKDRKHQVVGNIAKGIRVELRAYTIYAAFLSTSNKFLKTKTPFAL